jgi:hypothetical protein
MAIISTVGGENRLILGADRIARQPSFMLGTTWQKMRIGMRLCMSDSGANVSPADFIVGVCSGNSSIYGDSGSAPKHFYGISLVGSFATFTRGTSPTRYGCAFSSGICFVNGSLSTSSATNMEPSTWNIGADDSSRTLFFVDITKGNPAWSLTYFRNTNTACTDVDKDTFDAQVILPSPSLTDHSFQSPQSWNVNEAANGYMDHININWNFAIPVFKISDITVVKLA